MLVRIAIWGAGKMGQLHGTIYQGIEGVEIACVIEKNETKAKSFSEEFQCPYIDSIEKIEPYNANGIDICLPTWLHKEAIQKASNYFKWIFCEKPICLKEEEYSQICKSVEASHASVMVGQVLRFWNGYVKIKEILESGEIGKPRFITCCRRQKMPDWSAGNWLMDNSKSGGILMDLSIHDVDYLYWLFGKPKRLVCDIVKKQDTTLHSILVLSYEDFCAIVNASWGMPKSFNKGELEATIEIVGDTGMIRYSGGNSLEIIRDDDIQIYGLEETDGYLEELLYFVGCIQKTIVPRRSSLSSVKGTMEILWAAMKSQEQKRALCIEESAGTI